MQSTDSAAVEEVRMGAVKRWIEERREEVNERAEELFYEELEQLPRGVPVPAKEHYQECWERAREEVWEEEDQ